MKRTLFLLLAVACTICLADPNAENGRTLILCRGPYEHFLLCGSCDLTCDAVQPVCEPGCKRGCFCLIGYVRNNGVCIPRTSCPVK